MPHVARDRIAVLLLCLGLGGFGAGGVVALDRLNTGVNESVDEATLEESCRKFGNNLREGLREDNEAELHRVENPEPKTLALFGLTKQEAIELSAKRIKELEYNINIRYKDVPCGKVYKK